MTTLNRSIQQDINALEEEIDIITNENKDLDCEIEMATNKLRRMEKINQEKRKKITDVEGLEHEVERWKSELTKIETQVMSTLEVVEQLESSGVFNEEETKRILLEKEEEQDRMIDELRDTLSKEKARLEALNDQSP